MRKHKHYHPLLILLIGITAFTSLASLTFLVMQMEIHPTGGITGASIYESEDVIKSDTFELYEGYRKELDLNEDGEVDAELHLKYSDEGLAILELEQHKNSC